MNRKDVRFVIEQGEGVYEHGGTPTEMRNIIGKMLGALKAVEKSGIQEALDGTVE